MDIQPITEQPGNDETLEAMDKATQELSSFIAYLCDKYGAEFIVQRVIFTFVPKPTQEIKAEVVEE